jgi:DNA polymerase-3 subunit delta'
MSFFDVIGHKEKKYNLTETVYNNRLSHALLFLGKEGSGALPMAIAFAQFLVCEKVQRKNSDNQAVSLFGDSGQEDKVLIRDACGICSSCLRAQQLMHPDIHFSYPTIKKTSKSDEKPISTDFIVQWRDFVKGMPYNNDKDWVNFIKEHPHDKIDNPTNKQGNITAEECHDILRKLSLKSFESGYKILIMWMPEYLGDQGNKLLKLIEEPPPDTLFIFVAEDENAILPTILSRTQLIKIPSLSDIEIEQALITNNTVDAIKAKQIAGVSEGNYREALQMFQHAEENWQGMVREWLNTIVKTGPIAQVKWIDEISKLGREKQKQFLQYFIHLLQQALRIRIQATSFNPNLHLTNNIPEKDQDFAARLNKMCSLEAQEAIINELNKAAYYIERNAHAKMLFHALTIRLYHIIKDNSLILIN